LLGDSNLALNFESVPALGVVPVFFRRLGKVWLLIFQAESMLVWFPTEYTLYLLKS